MRNCSVHALIYNDSTRNFAKMKGDAPTHQTLHAFSKAKNCVRTPTLPYQGISIIFSAVFITAMFCKYLACLLAREHLNSFTPSWVEYSGYPQDKYIYKHSTYAPILAQLDKNNLNGVFTNACCFKICLSYQYSRCYNTKGNIF